MFIINVSAKSQNVHTECYFHCQCIEFIFPTIFACGKWSMIKIFYGSGQVEVQGIIWVVVKYWKSQHWLEARYETCSCFITCDWSYSPYVLNLTTKHDGRKKTNDIYMYFFRRHSCPTPKEARICRFYVSKPTINTRLTRFPSPGDEFTFLLFFFVHHIRHHSHANKTGIHNKQRQTPHQAASRRR